MAKTSILLALALDYFTRYPESNECHITSDKRVFHKLSTAESFGLSLENTEVASFTRDEAVNGKEVIVDTEAEEAAKIDASGNLDNNTATDAAGEGTDDAGEGTDDAEDAEDSPITLEQFDPATTEYAQGKELFTTLGLTAPSNKKADIFAALTAAKTAATKTEE